MGLAQEGQLEFNGVIIGTGTDVIVSSIDTGAASVSTPLWDRPGADGSGGGPSSIRGPQWLIKVLAVSPVSHVHLSTLAPFAGAWQYYPERRTNAPAVLRYNLPAQLTRRVYGRPAGIALDGEDAVRTAVALYGAPATAAFQLWEPDCYTDDEESVTLAQDGSTNFVPAGNAPSPFRLALGGPFASMTVTGFGWTIATTTPLAAGRTVIVDTLLGTSLIQDNGAHHPLTAGSDLSARIQPGLHTVTVTGTSRTAATSTILKWRDGWVIV